MRNKTLAVAILSVILLGVLAACGGTYNYGTVTFVDSDTGWVTGFDPTSRQTLISRTTDGGVTWSVVGSQGIGRPGRSAARIVGTAAFSTPTTGVWCVNRDKVFYTTTGGDPWSPSTITGMEGQYFSAMSFASATVGWAGSSRGAILKTTDAGANYAVQKDLKADGEILDIAAPTESICYALKDQMRCGVWATTDGGLTWARHRLPGRSLRPIYCDIDFPTDMIGYAVGGGGKIAKTTDGGVTWVAQVSGTGARLQGVCFIDADNGFAVGRRGTIVHTTDGGATWVAQTSGTPGASLNSVDFVSANEGWVVGKAGWAPGQKGYLLHTVDGGVTWTH